jgi:transcriptional regulator with XRE-family HTH domain
MAGKRGPHNVDIYVGNRVRVARQARKISQEALADQLGITFQQVQKYEKGSNRISAGRLYQMTGILGVPINFFFEGVGAANSKVDPAMTRANKFLATREGALIADAFPRLGKRTQQAILSLIKAGVDG